jgi:hypothetical protein
MEAERIRREEMDRKMKDPRFAARQEIAENALLFSLLFGPGPTEKR